jgi:hypothetical protein
MYTFKMYTMLNPALRRIRHYRAELPSEEKYSTEDHILGKPYSTNKTLPAG